MYNKLQFSHRAGQKYRIHFKTKDNTHVWIKNNAQYKYTRVMPET